MLGKRITEKRKLISLYDTALFELDADVREKYKYTRDFSLIPAMDTFANKPTVFTVSPPKPGHEDQNTTLLFALYVDDVENYDGAQWETVNGMRSMKQDSVIMFGSEVVDEIGTYISELSRSDTTPFTLPDGYSQYERRAIVQRAVTVRSEGAAS